MMDLNLIPILIGGGHEIALGHFNGLHNHFNNAPAIVNFDAHLDLRPYDKGGSSGTMFYQIADDLSNKNKPFSYLCIGTQTYANTTSLFKLADKLGATYIHAKDIKSSKQKEILTKINNFIEPQQQVYLTTCSDVISAAHAPGVSALQPFGMEPEIVLSLIKNVISSGKVCSIDIAEVSPRFDFDHRTAKLIAVFIYSIINTFIETKKH